MSVFVIIATVLIGIVVTGVLLLIVLAFGFAAGRAEAAEAMETVAGERAREREAYDQFKLQLEEIATRTERLAELAEREVPR